MRMMTPLTASLMVGFALAGCSGKSSFKQFAENLRDQASHGYDLELEQRSVKQIGVGGYTPPKPGPAKAEEKPAEPDAPAQAPAYGVIYLPQYSTESPAAAPEGPAPSAGAAPPQ
jgi:hypothetical protein